MHVAGGPAAAVVRISAVSRLYLVYTSGDTYIGADGGLANRTRMLKPGEIRTDYKVFYFEHFLMDCNIDILNLPQKIIKVTYTFPDNEKKELNLWIKKKKDKFALKNVYLATVQCVCRENVSTATLLKYAVCEHWWRWISCRRPLFSAPVMNDCLMILKSQRYK